MKQDDETISLPMQKDVMCQDMLCRLTRIARSQPFVISAYGPMSFACSVSFSSFLLRLLFFSNFPVQLKEHICGLKGGQKSEKEKHPIITQVASATNGALERSMTRCRNAGF